MIFALNEPLAIVISNIQLETQGWMEVKEKHNGDKISHCQVRSSIDTNAFPFSRFYLLLK